MPTYRQNDLVTISRRRSANGDQMTGVANFPARVVREPIPGIQMSGVYTDEPGPMVPLYDIELSEKWPSSNNRLIRGVPEDIIDPQLN